MDEDFCQAHPAIIINDDIRRLFDNIVAICEPNQDMKNPKLINDTLELIDRFRADIPDILAKVGNFRNGFENFLFAQSGIGLQPFEVEVAYDYIKKHLESTVGYWTENEVRSALKDWRIAENDRIAEERRKEEEERRRKENEEHLRKEEEERKRLEEEARNAKDKAHQELKGDPAAVAKKKISAREYIDSVTSPDELRQIINQIINLGYEFVIDKILETTSKNE